MVLLEYLNQMYSMLCLLCNKRISHIIKYSFNYRNTYLVNLKSCHPISRIHFNSNVKVLQLQQFRLIKDDFWHMETRQRKEPASNEPEAECWIVKWTENVKFCVMGNESIWKMDSLNLGKYLNYKEISFHIRIIKLSPSPLSFVRNRN